MARSSKREREEACYICGHYHDHDNGEPCSICGHVLTHSERKANEGVIPTAIIPGFLYLGSYDTASRSELLRAMAITHILNTVPTCQALFKNTFTYHTVSSSPPDFDECCDFIERVNKQEANKLLVYCMSGKSRSPTIIIGFLMKTRGWRLAETYKWVKEKRPTININAEDTQRLVDLEMKLYNTCSVPHGFAGLGTGDLFTAAASTSFQPPEPSSSAPVFGAASGQAWSMSDQGPCPACWSAATGAAAAPPAFGSAGGAGASPGGQSLFVFGAQPGAGQQVAQPTGGGADAEMEM